MKVLVFGANGMLGRQICKSFSSDFELFPATRHDCDLTDSEKIEPFILQKNPDVVVNAAAIIDINLCETENDLVYKVNSYAVSKMAHACNKINAKLVQISTDHYYSSNNDKKHDEDYPVTILNNYARTKFKAEEYASEAFNHLIVRTNIIGFKKSAKQKGFLEWALANIIERRSINLFNDYFSSSIDIYNFTEILKVAIQKDIRGLYNIASSEVTSKADMVELLAAAFAIPLNAPSYVSVNNQDSVLVRRADSLGLNVDKIQRALGLDMPNAKQVINKIKEVYDERQLNGE